MGFLEAKHFSKHCAVAERTGKRYDTDNEPAALKWAGLTAGVNSINKSAKANRLFLSVKMKNPRKNGGKSARQDLNLRPLRPERSALPS